MLACLSSHPQLLMLHSDPSVRTLSLLPTILILNQQINSSTKSGILMAHSLSILISDRVKCCWVQMLWIVNAKLMMGWAHILTTHICLQYLLANLFYPLSFKWGAFVSDWTHFLQGKFLYPKAILSYSTLHYDLIKEEWNILRVSLKYYSVGMIWEFEMEWSELVSVSISTRTDSNPSRTFTEGNTRVNNCNLSQSTHFTGTQ